MTQGADAASLDGDLTVGSWPGYGASHNPFVSIFLDALAGAGCRIVSLDTVEKIEAEGAVDVLMLHWPQKVFWEAGDPWTALGKIRRLVRSLARRPAGTRVVWLAHDLRPHDAAGFQAIIWRPYMSAVIRHVDAILTLSPKTVGKVYCEYRSLRGKPAGYVHHPAYSDAELPTQRRLELRRARKWGEHVQALGYCGQLRPYKGVDTLIRAFRTVRCDNLRLHIAGRPVNEEFACFLRQQAGDDSRISIDSGDLDGDSFRDALGICDVIVAPFHAYLHSGSLVHAISAGRPIFTPATPFAVGLQEELGSAWVKTYQGELTADLLEQAADMSRPSEPLRLEAFQPSTVGKKAADFLRAL